MKDARHKTVVEAARARIRRKTIGRKGHISVPKPTPAVSKEAWAVEWSKGAKLKKELDLQMQGKWTETWTWRLDRSGIAPESL